MRVAMLMLAAVVMVGCGGAPRNSVRRGEARAERRDDRMDAYVEANTGWNKLGERWVDGKADRDVLWVTAREGAFRKVMFKVEHSAVEMYDVIITFGDGSTFSPPTRLVFGREQRSRVVDLPGNARIIKKVEFRYGNLPGGGRAQVEIWAQ
jgi:hypothetical protein